jgi:hypothetical protein
MVVASAAGDAVADVSVSLIAAARPPRRHGEPVRITGPGFDVLAVLDARTGDPESWWAAVRSLAPPPGVTVLQGLPPGLLALAREHDGRLAVCTSTPFRASAVLTAADAARRAGWAGARSRRPAGLVLAGAAASLRLAWPRRKVAWAGAAAAACAVAVAVAAIIIQQGTAGTTPTAASQRGRSSGGGQQPLPGREGSGPGRDHRHSRAHGPAARRHHGSRLPHPAHPTPSVPSQDPSPRPTTGPSPTPQPSPSPSPGRPTPTPTPTPSPPGSMCLKLPSGWICL